MSFISNITETVLSIVPGATTTPKPQAQAEDVLFSGEREAPKIDVVMSDVADILNGTKDAVYNERCKPTKLTQQDYVNYATMLYNAMDGWGTDEKTVYSILTSDELNSRDKFMIMQAYGGIGHTYLSSDIVGDFSGKAEAELIKILMDVCWDCMNCDDPDLQRSARACLRREPGFEKYMEEFESELDIAPSNMIMGIRG